MPKYNNVELEYNGIKYKSKLEVMAAKLLTEAGLTFEYEKEPITLVPGFKGQNYCIEEGGTSTTSIRVSYTPDFTGDFWIMETKGMITPDFSIKWKMYKLYLEENGLEYFLYLPRNKKQILMAIEDIKNKREITWAFMVVEARIKEINELIEKGIIDAEPIRYSLKLGEKTDFIKNCKSTEMLGAIKEIVETFNLERLGDLELLIPQPDIKSTEGTKKSYL